MPGPPPLLILTFYTNLLEWVVDDFHSPDRDPEAQIHFLPNPRVAWGRAGFAPRRSESGVPDLNALPGGGPWHTLVFFYAIGSPAGPTARVPWAGFTDMDAWSPSSRVLVWGGVWALAGFLMQPGDLNGHLRSGTALLAQP